MVKSQRCCCNKRPSCNKRGCGSRGYVADGVMSGIKPHRSHKNNNKNNNKKSKSENAIGLTAGQYPHALQLAGGENKNLFKLAAGGRYELEQKHHNHNLDGGTALICRLQTSQDLGISKQNVKNDRQGGPWYPGPGLWPYGPGWGWWSDRRLKHSIEQLDKSPSGIPIYSFKYNQDVKSDLPSGTWSGVMAQDLLDLGHEDAVILTKDGFYSVDYSQLDVKFEPIM